MAHDMDPSTVPCSRNVSPPRRRRARPRWWWLAACLALAVLATPWPGDLRAEATDGNAASLREKYEALRDRLEHNQFQAPIYIESSEPANRLEGDLYGVVEQPFAAARRALNGTAQWCNILILHLNVKECRTTAHGPAAMLILFLGTKHDQPVESASRLDYVYRVVADRADYLQLSLTAPSGPFGTRDYRIGMEATPIGSDVTFVHLTYSYAYGTMAKIALESYLHTIGRAKVGFTVVGTDADGRPVHVGGVRGVVERNALRYYLAVVAYLHALSAPPQEQLERRLRQWFALTERYPLQLHEIDEPEYLDMKRREARDN